MIIVHYGNKVTRVRNCERCDGYGFKRLGLGTMQRVVIEGETIEFRNGVAMRCGCIGGKLVDYPWTRGRSVAPLIKRSTRRPGIMRLFE